MIYLIYDFCKQPKETIYYVKLLVTRYRVMTKHVLQATVLGQLGTCSDLTNVHDKNTYHSMHTIQYNT